MNENEIPNFFLLSESFDIEEIWGFKLIAIEKNVFNIDFHTFDIFDYNHKSQNTFLLSTNISEKYEPKWKKKSLTLNLEKKNKYECFKLVESIIEKTGCHCIIEDKIFNMINPKILFYKIIDISEITLIFPNVTHYS